MFFLRVSVSPWWSFCFTDPGDPAPWRRSWRSLHYASLHLPIQL